MNKVRRRKYKIYKKLKTDLWGDFLARYKRYELTSLILNEFEFNLNKIKRKNLKMFWSRYKLNNKKINFAKFKNTEQRFTSLNRIVFKSTSIRKLYRLSKCLKLLYRKFGKLWAIKRKQKNKLNWNVSKILRKIQKNRKKNRKILSVLNNRTKFKLGKYSEDNSAFSKSLNLRKFEKKKRIKNSIRMKLLEKKLSLFYGFKNTKNFKNFQDTAFYINKLKSLTILKLEARVTTITFRLNLAPTCYWAKKMIDLGYFEVNNILVKNRDFQVKLFDNISVTREKFDQISEIFFQHLQRNTFYTNVPNYIEFDQRILYASLWRLPTKNEITGPYSLPFGKSPYNWSMSFIPYRH